LTNKSQRNLQNILAIQKIFANSIDFENKCWYTWFIYGWNCEI